MKRFACRDVIPGCSDVFTGADDQSVLDQVIAHAAEDHGLLKPPLALIELVVATTHNFTPARPRGHLRLVGAAPSGQPDPDAVSPPDEQRTDQDTAHAATGLPPYGAPGIPDRVAPAIPFQRRGESLRISGPPPHGGWTAAATPTARVAPAIHENYRHECVFYAGQDGFLAEVIPFVRGGLELDQPVMVAVAEPRLAAVRAVLGDDAERVVLLDMAELGANPASIIPAWRDFAALTDGRPIRGVGEPIWAGRRLAEIVECQLHEALLNLAVDADTPLWLMCPYDITALDPAIITEARRGHPYVDGTHQPQGAWGLDDHQSQHAMALFTAPLPEPGEPTALLTAHTDTIGDVASRVFAAATAAGLPAQRSAKLAAAVDEVANAGTRNSGAAASVRLWHDRAALVCEVGDHGTISDPLVGRGSTLTTQSRERGIRLANELCDLVQVRSNSSGTTVRLHGWL